MRRTIWTAGALLLLGLLVSTSRGLAQRLSATEAAEAMEAACVGSENEAARGARLRRIADRLGPGAPDKRHAERRARAALERVAPLRASVRGTFEALRRAAIASTTSETVRARLARVQLAFGDGGELPDRALRRGCGADLLADDAWTSRGLDVVVLCPGFLLLEAESAASDSPDATALAVADASAFLLAHELGHVMDGRGDDPEAEQSADDHAAALLARVPAIDASAALRPFCGLPADRAHRSGIERVERALRAVRERGR